MKETFNYRRIDYTVEYRECYEDWVWRFDVFVDSKRICSSGSTHRDKSDAQYEAEREIDWKLSEDI